MSSEYDELKRIAIFGASGVGKSTLLNRATIPRDIDDPCDWATRAHESTIGVEFGSTLVDGTKFQIWDTSGQDRFRRLIGSYSRGSQILAFVVDASDVSSFAETKKLFDMVMPYSSPEAVVLLVNKMEAAVKGVAEAANALAAQMESEISRGLCEGDPGTIPVLRTHVSVTDPPSVVMSKLCGGGSRMCLFGIPDRPGGVRIPAVGQVEGITHCGISRSGGKV